MLDLVFLGIMIYVIVKADKGEYKETACNIGLVIGILAGVVGCVAAITRNDFKFLFLNIIVMLMSFALRFVARHLVKLYVDKQAALTAEYERDMQRRSRFDTDPVYTDDTFDDEEKRFGKGGWSDNDM